MTHLMEQNADETTQRASPVATWVRVSRLGAVVTVVWSIALQLEIGALMPPITVIGAVFGVLALLLTGERRKLAIATAVVALLALLGDAPMTIDLLTHPDSGVAFGMTVMSTLAVALMIIAGLAIVLGWSPSAARPVVISAATALVAGIAVGAVASAAVASSEVRAGDVTVAAELNEFDPQALVVDAGSTGFWLDNRDGIRHTLTVEGTAQEIDAPGYSSQRDEFALEPGDYSLICTVPGHENMRIDLTVEPAV